MPTAVPPTVPSLSELRDAIEAVAREELRLEGELPEGDLSAHLDSVQRLTLVVAIEDHFEIAFSPDDDEAVSTLDDVAACVQRHLRAQATDQSTAAPGQIDG